MGQFCNGVFENNVAIYCANLKPILSRFRANTTFHNFFTTFAPNQTAQEDNNFFTTFAPNQTAQEDTLWNPIS